MKLKFILGVDMSKDWFNFCLMNAQFEIIWEGQIDNTPDTIFRFLSKLSKRKELLESQTTLSEITLVMEHTGIYVNHLVRAYLGKGAPLTLVHASKISEQLAGKGLWDEKTDEIDARRLAEYGIRYNDKLKLWQVKDHTLTSLQALQRQRKRLIDVLNILQVPVNESVNFDTKSVSDMLKENQKSTIKVLKSDIKNIEKLLEQLIDEDEYLRQIFKQIKSVPGVGPVIAREIIINTSAFTDYTPDQAKQFARNVGVTPKHKQSGKKKRGKRTTKRGNKNLKSLLTMGATSVARGQSDLGKYYQRKILEGKAHFSVINAMRNKMILRIFAVVRNQVIYDANYNISVD